MYSPASGPTVCQVNAEGDMYNIPRYAFVFRFKYIKYIFLKKLKTDSKVFKVSLWKDDILQYIQKYSENTYDFIYKTRSQQITRITWLWIFNKLSMHSWNLKNIKKCTEKAV